MQDRLSLMLDSMITAVDQGFSYDGIVSIPEMGLEDFGRRPGLAGWLDGGMELLRTTKAAISLAVAGWFSPRATLPSATPPGSSNSSPTDSGIHSNEQPPEVRPATPIDEESSPNDDTFQNSPGTTLGIPERLPRKRDKQASQGTDTNQKLPQEESELGLENITSLDIGQSSLISKREMASHSTHVDQELSIQPRLTNPDKLLRRREETAQPSRINPERHPRLRIRGEREGGRSG